jgi:mono/diheme cytochrome c family protein
MKKFFYAPTVALAGAAFLLSGVLLASPQNQAQSAPPQKADEYRAVLDKYCFACHNSRTKSGGLALDKLDLTQVADNADVWEKVIRKVRVGMMPPQAMPHPDDATRQGLIAYLETALDAASAAKPNPGRPLVHRLNRNEYANAIHDLLALDVDPATLLPADDAAFGFDNMAEVLGVSPVLLERYMNAAGTISALAVGDPGIGRSALVFPVRQDASQDVHIEGLPIGTIGGIQVRPTLPLNGEYQIQVKLYRTNLGAMRGLELPHQLEISVDGARVHTASFGGDADFKASLANITAAADAVDARFTVQIPLKAGPRSIGIAFLEESPAQGGLRLQPFIRSSNDTLDATGHPHVERVIVTGPFNATGPGDTPSRRQIFTCRPAGAADEEPCARGIVSTLAHRAYRGTESPNDIRRLMEFYADGRKGGTFESGIELSIERVLASPKFLFRTERESGANVAAGTVYRVSDLELASQLSFFLWSSIPDDQLLQLAGQGKLSNPAVLDAQVKRMLADPKADRFVGNFAGQWLYLRNLRTMQPNSLDFPDFDDNLRVAFQRETELFFGSIMKDDRNVIDLMTANYTFVNERLAKHYGIPNVYGSQFRRVPVTDEARRGILGQGSVLMVTSHTDRTSPVVRGRWVLENLLGAAVPPPPPNVPPLNEDTNGKVLTMRQRMEEHRANPACAGCHTLMDPIGLAMENFDAVGAWRSNEGGTHGKPLDVSGQLLDGSKVNGPVELRQALLRQPDIFVQTVTEKLMTYALGRGLGASDLPTVRAIVRDAGRNDDRFSSLILGIVHSAPFQERMRPVEEAESSPPSVKVAAR